MMEVLGSASSQDLDCREQTELMVLSYRNELADHLHAARLYYVNIRWAKADKVVAVLLLTLGGMAIYTLGLQWWAVLFLIAAPLEWFNLLSLHPLRVRFAFKTDPKFREPYQLAIDDSGIHFSTPSIDSRIAWTYYGEVLESDRVFLLIYGRYMYSVVPKRAFGSEEQIGEFREILRRNVG